jgi:hypothetical protein
LNFRGLFIKVLQVLRSSERHRPFAKCWECDGLSFRDMEFWFLRETLREILMLVKVLVFRGLQLIEELSVRNAGLMHGDLLFGTALEAVGAVDSLGVLIGHTSNLRGLDNF